MSRPTEMSTLDKVKLNITGFPIVVKQVRQQQLDILIAVGLAIAIAILTYAGTYQIPDPVFTDFYAQDVWFGSDIPTVFGNITSFNSDFGRNNKHPLFPLIVFPVVFGLGKLLNLEPIAAARIVIVLTAVLWVGSLYALFRLMGCQRLDATLLSMLGVVSAASIFWLVVPESFPLGSVTIILGLLFAVLTQYRQFSFLWYVVLNVVTVSITITNAMVGIFTTLVNQNLKRVAQIGIASLVVSTGLWILQRIVFTNAGFPFQPGTFLGEKKFVSAPEHSGVLAAMSSFFYQTMVMPAVHFLDSPIRPDWVKLDTNTLAPASAGWLGMVAVVAWSVLLLLGLWGFISTRQHTKFRIVLGLTLIAQMAMHSIYGAEETFIYSLHFAPLLLAIVAFSLLTRLRFLSLALIAILILSAGITNRAQFATVTANLWNYGTPRQQVEFQMHRRPQDPWLRSEGHVVLATAGSSEADKAFHEPGGSFSPQPGSFGVSIWVVDTQGNLTATSDTIPLNEIEQQFVDNTATTVPGIVTKTPYYQASWNLAKPGRWQFSLEQATNGQTKPVVVIRSVGPAGGTVNSLDWNGQRLLINNRWIIKNLPDQARVFLGSERSPRWTQETSTVRQWQDERGWGYARIEGDVGTRWTLEVEDLAPTPAPILANADTAASGLDLPDTQFTDSFKAQIKHLTMGLVGNQTRPGDPIEYPLPRLREGAYTVVALARTGHLELAKQLVPYFAATDWVNGTQASADSPALGIWALTTVAAQVNQPEYDQSLWPDVYRKAELILDLLASNRPGYPVATASEVPFSEHADFVRVDVMAGRMNATPGLIALDPAANFMGYRALLDAAALADRVQQPQVAERWRSHAAQLQTAWQEAFDLQFAAMDATYTTGLWPSALAMPNSEAFSAGLESRWQASRDETGQLKQRPEQTNIPLAEAHQWLYLNQPERVWSTLQWFWENQASQGLYTWWGKLDGASRIRTPASLSQWHRFRGWVNPPHVTPYYWTTAEMVLLQLDMLAYVSPTASEPTLVVGAGIPSEWLNQTFSAKGLLLGGNVVDWEWDGKQMNVQIQGQPMDVQLGSGFPATTPINVAVVQP